MYIVTYRYLTVDEPQEWKKGKERLGLVELIERLIRWERRDWDKLVSVVPEDEPEGAAPTKEQVSDLAEGIRRMHQRLGLKQKDTAAAVGLSPGQLNGIIHGRKVLRADLLFALAEAMGCTVQDIWAAGMK